MLSNHFLQVKSNIWRAKWAKSQQRNLGLFEMDRWRCIHSRVEYSIRRGLILEGRPSAPRGLSSIESTSTVSTRIPPCLFLCMCLSVTISFSLLLWNKSREDNCVCANRVLVCWNVQGSKNASSRASHGINTTVKKKRRPGEFSFGDNFLLFFFLFFLEAAVGLDTLWCLTPLLGCLKNGSLLCTGPLSFSR